MQYDITCLIKEGCLSPVSTVEEEYNTITRVRLHVSSACMTIVKVPNSLMAIVDPKHTTFP